MKSKRGYRKAVFIVTYRINNLKKPEYLLLKRKLHWIGWEFPKGGIDKGETKLETAKREIKEETGQNPIKIKKYETHGKYIYKKILSDRPDIKGQIYTLFSAELKDKKIKIDKKEHSAYTWLPFNKAVEKLTWSNQKKCLKIVNNNLK